MPECLVCHHELQTPREAARDWFRCDIWGTFLQVPSRLGKVLFGLSTMALLIVIWTYPLISSRYLRGLHFPLYFVGGFVLALCEGKVQLVWKTKLTRPRPYDPHRSLNLNDKRKKSLGRN